MNTRKQPSGSLRRKQQNGVVDPNQIEFGITWRSLQHPFRLRAGDVIRFDNRLCRIIRVNDCSALVTMNRPVREFTTRFDKVVCFQPKPAIFRISPDSEVEVLNRKAG